MPKFPFSGAVNPFIFSPANVDSIGPALNGMGLGITPSTLSAANKAIFIPFSVAEPVTLTNMFVINGTTVAGSLDVGIYDAGGARIVSSGPNLQSGTSSIQELDIPGTYMLPGAYYLAMVSNNSTGTYQNWNFSAGILRPLGVVEQTNAFPLPTTAAFATLSGNGRAPFVGAAPRSIITV